MLNNRLCNIGISKLAAALFFSVTIAMAFSNHADAKWAKMPFQVEESASAENAVADVDTVYRLFNPYSGEHFYTLSISERDYLDAIGWKNEGKAWICPHNSDKPVYRLFNPNIRTFSHFFTSDVTERDGLTNLGWKYEGIAWYGCSSGGCEVYRLYNSSTGEHFYTLSKDESNFLVKSGWLSEGVAWRAKCEEGVSGDNCKADDVTVNIAGGRFTKPYRQNTINTLRNNSIATAQVNAEIRQATDECRRVLSEITTENMSKREQVQAVIDWMQDNFEYADRKENQLPESYAAYLGDGGVHEQIDYQIWLTRKGVCSDYADGFLIAMEELDIPCGVVENSMELNHAWNVVAIDDAAFEADVAWESPLLEHWQMNVFHHGGQGYFEKPTDNWKPARFEDLNPIAKEKYLKEFESTFFRYMSKTLKAFRGDLFYFESQ